ncbi:site-specific recombinase, DNA invertase Pin [Halalkaliarchaeum desulfuricum]|uniref:Site-specific recombinase, DNA invertase Pin n=1 Tax=Halalkaliarchaeum desulfuricum TaxID=2055893 RepID=A0A343TJN8_9EURY|nr:recombinase family protein [Halalkaliarchaeum desulfuricum]AUX09310.1 site-specific recombinase, DNA invertase Pin [Halalkaliarchaeum desulfuricum]
MTTESEESWAYYVRVSTDKQDSGQASQLESVAAWLRDRDVDPSTVDAYVDRDESGSRDDRADFQQLVAAVEAGEYTDVVLPELSRLARRTATSAAFIDEAVAQDVTIHLLDDMIDRIDADDPMSQFFAKMLSVWMEEERKQTVRRIRRGVTHAQREGKWTGRPPVGFETNEEGYLVVDIEEFEAVCDALERLDAGESYRSVAKSTRFTRRTLSTVDKNSERRQWYLEGEAADDRVDTALDR